MTREEEIKKAAIARYGNYGNESQYMMTKIQAFIVGARWADKHPKGSIIKWQTGEPKESGAYLITTIEETVAQTFFNPDSSVDVSFFDTCVAAWCRLSDIEPYKEKEE